MNAIKIAPSILSADFVRLGEHVQEAVAAGADVIHVDVMDGSYVPNITVGVPVIKALRRVTDLPLDVHLMIVQPERHVQAFADAGVNTLTVHVEACVHLHRALQLIRDRGVRAGVALNPHTPAVMIELVYELLDQVLVMTVNPGFGGQEFLPAMLPKIREVRRQIEARRLPIDLQVDGGIDPETVGRVVRAGANVLVAGNAIFGASEGVGPALRAIREGAWAAQQQSV